EHRSEKYLTMEFVEGEPLSAVITREKVLPVIRVVELTAGICAGIAAAHAAGIVHRDLKPDNILVATDGRAVITDFGIARTRFDVGTRTGIGVIMGTPAYMAPEQVEGAGDIDGRADIYALGVILYELLTGERPWNGNTPLSTVMARLTSDPP